MKLIKYATWIVTMALLVGCATTFRPWKLSEVEEGMDRAQVVGILGEPDSSETKDGAEFLYYSYSEDYNPTSSDGMAFSSDHPDQLRRDRQVRKSLNEYKYSIKLVEGKVLNYKESTDQAEKDD